MPQKISSLNIESKSAHYIEMKNYAFKNVKLIAYPGWRWRIEGSTYYHEPIPNFILRNWDKFKRRIRK